MHKYYRPSWFTQRLKDDTRKSYYYAVSPKQIFFTMFKEKYGIQPTTMYKEVWRKSELFIASALVQWSGKNCIECDLSDSYKSWKSLDKEYIGFSSDKKMLLIRCDCILESNGVKAALVVCSSISFVALNKNWYEAFTTLYSSYSQW
jgi:hypothetical protein